MESLGDLISVCRAADTEKVTERKVSIHSEIMWYSVFIF